MKKLQFITFLAMASFMGLHESHGYKIHCPELPLDVKTKGDLVLHEPGFSVQFSGKAKNENGGSIQMESSMRPWEHGLKDDKFTFNHAFINNNGQLACHYLYNLKDTITLTGDLPAGANCHNPKNHDDPYVECQ